MSQIHGVEDDPIFKESTKEIRQGRQVINVCTEGQKVGMTAIRALKVERMNVRYR